MASAPDVKTTKLTRDKLAKFLPNHEAIKCFENLTQDVSQTLPAASLANTLAAAAAQASANAAQDEAILALTNAAAAQATADQALNAGGTDPGLSMVLAEISSLRARIAALEQGTAP